MDKNQSSFKIRINSVNYSIFEQLEREIDGGQEEENDSSDDELKMEWVINTYYHLVCQVH